MSGQRVRFGIIVFPGSNCDADCYYAVRDALGQEARYIWHQAPDLGDVDCVVLPGGFSYGDYLRAGAIARFAPIMAAVERFAARGGLVLGICNGFQILCEAGLLPGGLVRNTGLRFRCETVTVRVENAKTPFTHFLREGQLLQLPIAHGEGCYYADAETLAALEERGQVVFRYASADGQIIPEANPNGSVRHIAGVCNPAGNVLGLMPHPERNAELLLGNGDGRWIFASMVESAAESVKAR